MSPPAVCRLNAQQLSSKGCFAAVCWPDDSPTPENSPLPAIWKISRRNCSISGAIAHNLDPQKTSGKPLATDLGRNAAATTVALNFQEFESFVL
jgi:hypothetical protein